MHIDPATVGAAIYEAANLSPAAPPDGGCEEIAERCAIPILERPQRLWADTFTLHGRRQIAVRRGLSDRQYNWATGWALASIHLERNPMGLDRPARGLLCNRVATWLAAPSPALAEAHGAVDIDVRQIAAEFALPEAATALGVAELPGGPSCVVVIEKRRRVLRCGPLLRGFSEATILDLARARRLKSLRRVVLEEGVALFALPAV